MIEITFDKFKIKALVDTGVQVSVLTKEIYDKLVDTNQKMDIILIKKFMLKGAFLEKDQIINNKINLKFKYNEQQFNYEFYIVQKMSYKIILGILFNEAKDDNAMWRTTKDPI